MVELMELLTEVAKRESLKNALNESLVTKFLPNGHITAEQANSLLGFSGLDEIPLAFKTAIMDTADTLIIAVPTERTEIVDDIEVNVPIRTFAIANRQVYPVEGGEIEYSNPNPGLHQVILFTEGYRITAIDVEVVAVEN